MRIMTNISAENAGRMLQLTESDNKKSTEKLSSGYRINRSADDAAGLSISEKIRKQVRGLERSGINLQDGISFSNVADGALNEVTNMLQRENELLIQAANGTNSQSDRQAIQDELVQLSEEMNRIFSTTKFNERYVFGGNNKEVELEAWTEPILRVRETDPHTTTTTSIVYKPKGSGGSVPPDETTTTRTVVSRTTDKVNVDLDMDNTADEGTWSYVEYQRDEKLNITHTRIEKITNSYEDLSDAEKKSWVTLRKPSVMVGNTGYINAATEQGNLALSCAMTQVGVKIDGNLINYSILSSSYSMGTVNSNNGDTATTRFNVGSGMILTQEITLVNNGGAYQITYTVQNTSSSSHTIDTRLAFDAMNTQADCVKNGSTNFTLESDFAKISIGATNTTNAVLGCINDLYGTWDDSKVTHGDPVKSNHTGVGFWWEGQTLSPGETRTLGTAMYGPIELKVEPYRETKTVDTSYETEERGTAEIQQRKYEAGCFQIQAGAETAEFIHVPIYKLTAQAVFADVGGHISAFWPEDSIRSISRGIKRVAGIRSVYGALTNRFEAAYRSNTNTAENLDASDSRLRDTDMAEEMVRHSKSSILLQAGQSMLAQANQSNQGVLALLG